MQYSLIVLAVLFVCALAGAASSDGALLLDHERPHQSLNGSWRMLLEHGDEEVWNPAVRDAAGWRWHDVTVPGPLLTPPKGRNATREQHQKMHETQMKTKFVWIRRTFEVGADRAKQNAVLKWGGIRFGAKVWVNGKLVADWVPISPHTVLLPKGLLKAGKNDITIRIPGWAGLPKSKSGYPLTPTGGATQNWGGKGPAVFGDIWLEFYDKVYLKRVLAMPDVEKKTVTFRVQLDSVEAMPEKVDVEAMVIRPGAGLKFVPTARVCVSGRDSADITCDPGSPELWTPQSPALYQASISAAVDGERCDGMDFYFGFRQITIKGGHFALNGKRLWLRGSNLVHEWGWGEKFNENVKQYIVDEARNMSLNCFRTHTEPPTTLWANTGDRYGTMILAETPLAVQSWRLQVHARGVGGLPPQRAARRRGVGHEALEPPVDHHLGHLQRVPLRQGVGVDRAVEARQRPRSDAADHADRRRRQDGRHAGHGRHAHVLQHVQRRRGAARRGDGRPDGEEGPEAPAVQHGVHEPDVEPRAAMAGQGRRPRLAADVRRVRHGAHRGDATAAVRLPPAVHVRGVDEPADGPTVAAGVPHADGGGPAQQHGPGAGESGYA